MTRRRNHMDCWSGTNHCLLNDPECPMSPERRNVMTATTAEKIPALPKPRDAARDDVNGYSFEVVGIPHLRVKVRRSRVAGHVEVALVNVQRNIGKVVALRREDEMAEINAYCRELADTLRGHGRPRSAR